MLEANNANFSVQVLSAIAEEEVNLGLMFKVKENDMPKTVKDAMTNLIAECEEFTTVRPGGKSKEKFLENLANMGLNIAVLYAHCAQKMPQQEDRRQ